MPLSYWHGRATTSMGRANLLDFSIFFCLDEGTAVPPQARAVPPQARAVPPQAQAVPTFWLLRLKNFPLS